MSLQSVIHGNTNSYILEILTDIESDVIISNSIEFIFYEAVSSGSGVYTSEAPSGYYQKGNIIQSFKPDSVSTNNEDLNLFQIITLSQDYSLMGIRLEKQSVYEKIQTDGTWNKEFVYTEISPDFYNNQSDPYFLNSNNNAGIISLSLLENLNKNINGVLKATDFEYKSVYNIKINIKKLFINETLDKTISINFITNAEEIDNIQYNTNPNNVIFTTNRLNILNDIDLVFSESNELNYSFVPVIQNSDNIFVKDVDENENEIALNFNITSVLESHYIKQYLSEYSEYFKSIYDIQKIKNIFSENTILELNTLKQIMLKNSNMANSIFKGNKNGMSTVFDVFCKSTGYHLLAIEESPSLQNFVYRITSSLPKEYWLGCIKEIIHPVSWNDEYIYVDISDSESNLYYELIRKSFLLDKEIPVSYLDIAHKEKYHLYPSIFDLSIFDDYHTNAKFNFNANEYTANTIGYNNAELLGILINPSNLSTNVFVNTNSIDIETEYLITGVALEYKFEISLHSGANEVLYQSITSFTPFFSTSLPYSAEDFNIKLTLINKNFKHLVAEYNSVGLNLLDDPNNFVKDGDLVFYTINQFKKYIWIVKDNFGTIIDTIETTINNIDVSSFTNQRLYLTLVYPDGFQKTLVNYVQLSSYQLPI